MINQFSIEFKFLTFTSQLVTLQVNSRALPVIRSPNYTDLTWDIPIEKIPLVVGNEKGSNLHVVTLKEYLANFRNYLHKPNSWKGNRVSLLAPRDTHVVTSAQACFLPIPSSEDAKFNVAIYNYQTSAANPAVLAIVASSKGTSAQVLGQNSGKLFFNNNGERCSFVGQRLSDYRIEQGQTEDLSAPMSQEEKQQNMLLIIQVPLKQKARVFEAENSVKLKKMSLASAPSSARRKEKKESNVEDAIISIGESEGEFNEVNNLEIERDENYPVRVTMQFYKATDNGVVNEQNIKQISEQIQGARKNADFIGSLVVAGTTNRPTEPNLPSRTTNNYIVPPWWTEFWLVYGPIFPQYTEQRAKDKVFSGGRYSNSSMNDVREQIIDILGAESDPNKRAQPVWNIL